MKRRFYGMKRKMMLAAVLAVLLILSAGSPAANAAVFTSDSSFEDEEAGTDAGNTQNFAFDWVGEKGVEASSAVVAEDDTGKYLHIDNYYEFYSYDYFDAGYTFSIDVRTANGAAAGFFVRSGRNPEKFPFYEWDWYTERGGKNGESGIGGTGISVHLLADVVRVNIKNYQADGSNVSNSYYDFTNVEGYLNPAENFNTISIADEGERIVIHINGRLLATIALSNVGTYEVDKELPPLDFVYYKTAVMKNAAGEEILKIDNARGLAEDYMAAIGIRGGSADIDNVTISYEKADEPDQTEMPNTTAPADQTEAPEATQPVSAATATIKPAATKAPGTEPGTETDADNHLAVWIAAAAAAVVIAAIIVVLVVRKKKNKS